ncbi:MAG: hypothetical protein ACRBBP_10210 [Bdellovibrionales bacterium]
MFKTALITTFLVFFSITSQAQIRCKSIIRVSEAPSKVFSADELLNLEMASAAILASRIGRSGYEGLTKTPETLELGIRGHVGEVAVGTKRRIAEQIQEDIVSVIMRKRVRGVDVRYFVKKGLKSPKVNSVNVQSLKEQLQNPDALNELSLFIDRNIDAIIDNALRMPLENRFKARFKRSFNKANFFTLSAIVGTYALWTTHFMSNNPGFEKYLPLFALLVPENWAMLGGSSMSAGLGWSLLRNNAGSPVYDLTKYDHTSGQDVRDVFKTD